MITYQDHRTPSVLRLLRCRRGYLCRLRVSAMFIFFFTCFGGVPVQGKEGFGGWFDRATQAPAELQRPLEKNEPSSTMHPQAPDVSRRDILQSLPEVTGDSAAVLTTEELSTLSFLLTTLDPSVDVEPSAFLEKLMNSYSWEQSTHDQLAFIQMIYASSSKISSSPDPATDLDVFMSRGLDFFTLRKLNQDRIFFHSKTESVEKTLEASWRQLVLNTSPDGDPVMALKNYAELTRFYGMPRISPTLIAPQHAGEMYWEESFSRPSNNTDTIDPSPDLLQQINQSIIYGPPSTGLLAAQRSLALATTTEIWQIFDALGMISVRGTRDLRYASEPLRWHMRRVTQQKSPFPEKDHFSSRLNQTWAQAVAAAKSDFDDPQDTFLAESNFVKQLVLRNQLKRWSDAHARWAVNALEAGRPGLSALFWGQALRDVSLADDPADPARAGLERMVNTLGAVLRRQGDRDLAVEMIRKVDRELELSDSHVRKPLLFLGATLLYEQGRMADCLLALDQVEKLDPQWSESKRLTVGLIRAVAQIKLGRLEDAESALSGLALLDGENEVMAQVAFLRGWIHLNRNETRLALEHFRDLVGTYPGTTYTAKAMELVSRLEHTSAADR